MFIAGKHVSISATDNGLEIIDKSNGMTFRLGPQQTEEFIIMTEMLKAGAQIHVHVGPVVQEQPGNDLPSAGYN